MCGRYSLTAPWQDVQQILSAEGESFEARYNIAPTQEAPVLRQGENGHSLELLKWGLIPHWAKDEAMGSRLINARSETAAEKPSFRTSFRHRRCLVPASGFYEWKGLTPAKKKQPYHIENCENELFAMAGLWSQWTSPEGKPVSTFTILTTAAAGSLQAIHHRMPLVLPADRWDPWLDPLLQETEALLTLIQDPVEHWSVTAVQSYVNNARHEGPQCHTPAEIQQNLFHSP